MPTRRAPNGIPALFPSTSQIVSYSAGAGTEASSAFGENTECVRVISTTDCYIAFGATGVSVTTASLRLTAGVPEYFNVDVSTYVAAYGVAAAGVLTATEML